MIKKIIVILAVFAYSSASWAVVDLEALAKEARNNEMILRDAQGEKRVQALVSRSIWPSVRPANATMSTFSWFNDQFNVYVWRESGHAWMQVVPIAGDPFVCSSSFSIVQNGVFYDDIKMESYSGSSRCNDVYVPEILLIDYYSFSAPPNFNSAFTLYHDGGQGAQSLHVPLNNEPAQPPRASTGTVSDDLSVYSPALTYGNDTIWIDFRYYGTDAQGNMLWRLHNYGVNQ